MQICTVSNGDGSRPISTVFEGMNIPLPTISGFTIEFLEIEGDEGDHWCCGYDES
jgi:hypothetical protein